jgi:hypothetical protein
VIVQTRPELGRSCLPEDTAKYGQLRVYRSSPFEIQASNTFERHLPQNDRPAASVIAQQYSSVTFIALRCLFLKEKFGAPCKNVALLSSFLNIG